MPAKVDHVVFVFVEFGNALLTRSGVRKLLGSRPSKFVD
jgi:hypothetical protein